MNSRELPFREIDGSSFFGAAERTGRRGARPDDVVPRDEG